MNAYLITCSAAFVAAAGCLVYESRVVAAQSRELKTLHARKSALTAQWAAEKKVAASASANVVADIPASAPASLTRDETVELTAWLVRVQQLKQLVAAHPEVSIPELELLTPADWLRVTKTGQDSSDSRAVRKTLADLRGAAKNHLVLPLTRAFRKYLEQNRNELPSTPLALATYLERPLNPAILGRYEMVRSGNTANLSAHDRTSAAMRERAPIDDEFDVRLQFDSNGIQGRPAGITAWIDNYQDRVKQARADYARANSGATSTKITELAPYMNPPLTAAQLEKVVTWESSLRQ
jgi:hypothetical protein